MRGLIRGLFLILLFGVMTKPEVALGQGGATGAISGMVEDVNGGAVANADVQIFNSATNILVRRLNTGADGSFVTALLPPAVYFAVINKSGFSEAKATGIEVRVTETSRVTIALKPGTVSEKIEISAQVASVDTTSATTGQTIGPETIRELPLSSQNYQQLLTLSTGAQSNLNSSAELGRGTTKIFVNGQREDNNNYLIEGISATDYNVAQNYYVPLPNPDVIQEFKVQTSLYDATQGRNGGGNINAVLKSGTNQYHGDAYEFFRNDVLNANEYFHNANGQARPPVKQNIFGASFGGPVIKESLGFFFVNYQGTRQTSALSPGTQINNPGFPILPADRSAANLAAVFSSPATLPTANNPLGCAAAPITIDPVVAKLLSFQSSQFGSSPGGFLIPTVAGTPGVSVNPDNCQATINSGSLLVTKPGKFTDDQFTTNWDREFNSNKDKVSARFFFSNSETALPFGAGGLQASLGGTLATSISATDLDFPFDIPVKARLFTVSETHLFKPSLINDFRFGFVRMNYDLNNTNPVTVADLGIDRPTNNLTQSIYKFTFGTSGFQIGPTPPANQSQVQNNFNVVDDVSWIKGAHLFRFGGEYTRVNLDKLFPQTFNGQIFFVNGGGFTDWQNFLQGSSAFSFGGGGVYNHEYRTSIYGFFAQDDWKIRQNLTLNLGLRTDINGAFHDNLCHIGNIDESLAAKGLYPMIYGGCANQLKVPGLTGSGDDSTFKNGYSTGLAPRIGLAYDLGGHQKTTVRAGYGIYYVREDVGTADQLSFQAPYLPISFAASNKGCLGSLYSATPLPGCPNNALPKAGTLDPTFIPCTAALQGFPGGDTTQGGNFACAAGSPGTVPTTSLFVLAVPRKFVTPSTQQWNLTLQRDLGRQWVLEVGYIGTHATHLRETRTNIPGQNATPASPITVTAVDGTPYLIKYNTINNGGVRSPILAINGYGAFQIFANDAYSHYHSLQTTLSRRWGHGYFQAAYTWSKSTDATSSGNTALNTAYNDESDLKNSRGFSDFDRPHRLAVSYRYDLPFFSSSTGFVHAALGGWAISGITIIQSGNPFTVTDSTAGSAYLGPGYTPTLTGSLVPGASISSGYTSGSTKSRLNGYLNVNQFTSAQLLYPFDPLNPATTCDPVNNPNFCTTAFGNLGRNTFRGPYQQNWDFSLLKNFRVTERVNVRFATDFFNVFNHANFANPALNDVETITHDSSGKPTSDGPFGKIFSTIGTPRVIQFSLRVAF
jgi:hypothetical protein